METILIDQKDIASLVVQKHTEPLPRPVYPLDAEVTWVPPDW